MRRDEQQKQDLLWVISMMVTAIIAVLLAGSALFDFTLPDRLPVPGMTGVFRNNGGKQLDSNQVSLRFACSVRFAIVVIPPWSGGISPLLTTLPFRFICHWQRSTPRPMM